MCAIALRSPSLIGSLSIIQEDLGIADIHRIVILCVLGIWIRITILTKKLLHIVTSTRRVTNLIQSIVIVGSGDVGIDGCTLILAAIIDNVEIQAWITLAVRIQVIIFTALICDRITIGSRESIHQVLGRIDTSLTIERWREVISLLVQTEVPIICTISLITTPDNLLRACTRLQIINLISLSIPRITCFRQAAYTTNQVEQAGCIISSTLIIHIGTLIKSRAGSKERNLCTDSLGDTTAHTTTHQRTQYTVIVLIVVHTHSSVFFWHRI